MRIRTARRGDLAAVRLLLAAAGLPAEDVGGFLATAVVGVHGGEVVACGVLEPLGRAALLRSIAVAPRWRGRGWGGRIAAELLALAAALGMPEAWLLTTTAERWFADRGFVRVPREAAPPALRRTTQFASVCPASAALMVKRPDPPTRSGEGARPARPAGVEDHPKECP